MSVNLIPGDQELCAAKILIIDDEAADIRVLEWALRQAGFANLLSLTDPTRSRAEFDRFQPDVVLLDLFMPEMDGFAVLQQLGETVAADDFLPVLVLTGNNTTETRNRALKAGATDFLGKPVDYAEVVLRVKNLLLTRFLYRQAQASQARLKTPGAAQPPVG
jgi:PleD family two-component response regulator